MLFQKLSLAAEFIIYLAEKHHTFDGFKAVLVENGAEFTVSVKLDNDQSYFFGCFVLFFFHVACFRTPSSLICSDLFKRCDLHLPPAKVGTLLRT